MKAMILAAGLGKRMRPLTEHVPKPLLKANNKYLISYHLERLAEAGFKDVVINTHWLGEQLPEALGSGETWGLNLTFSHEETLLETAGGILKALPALTDGQTPFLLINGDVFTDLDLSSWLDQALSLNESCQAYLALVENPEHNVAGDFAYDSTSKQLATSSSDTKTSVTYAGIALFHPSFFAGLTPGPQQLGPLLKTKIEAGFVYGELLKDFWLDVGTPERLQELEDRLAAK